MKVKGWSLSFGALAVGIGLFWALPIVLLKAGGVWAGLFVALLMAALVRGFFFAVDGRSPTATDKLWGAGYVGLVGFLLLRDL